MAEDLFIQLDKHLGKVSEYSRIISTADIESRWFNGLFDTYLEWRWA